MAIDGSGTLLELTGITLPNYSSRSLTLKTTPIDPGGLAYDANGTLHDLTMTQFRKYAFTITCTDTVPPVFDSIFKGSLVTIRVVPHTGLSGSGSPEVQQQFDCMVVSWETSVDEWGARTGWTLELLER